MSPHDVLVKARIPYYEIERALEALTAAGFVIVPIKPNDDMIRELARIGDGPGISGEECWGYMLAAASAHPEPGAES